MRWLGTKGVLAAQDGDDEKIVCNDKGRRIATAGCSTRLRPMLL